MTLSRRTFVVASGALSISVPLSRVRDAHAATARPTPPRLDLIATTSVLFDNPFTAAHSFVEALGVIVTASRQQLSDARLEVTYDSRVLAAASTDSTVSSGKHLARRSASVQNDDQDGSLSIDLSGLGEDDPTDVAVALPLTRHALYPNDAVERPRATEIRLIDKTENTVLAVATAQAGTDPVAGPVWGATVTAVWASLAVDVPGRDSNYSYPAFIRVTSAGPAAIPRGAHVTISLDAQLTRLVSILAYRGDDASDAVEVERTEEIGDGARTIVLGLTESIAANESLTIVPVVVSAQNRQEDGDLFYARVSIKGPEAGSPLQRVTGRETAVAVTGSGVPRHADAFTGKI